MLDTVLPNPISWTATTVASVNESLSSTTFIMWPDSFFINFNWCSKSLPLPSFKRPPPVLRARSSRRRLCCCLSALRRLRSSADAALRRLRSSVDAGDFMCSEVWGIFMWLYNCLPVFIL